VPTPQLHPHKTTDRGYEPTYEFPGDRINDQHVRASEVVADVAGWLRPEDALKLYELAYFAHGPIVEIGSYRGKSTTILAMAARDAGHASPIVSIDVDPEAGPAVYAAARARGVQDRLVLVRSSAHGFFAANPSCSPALVFLDGDHTREGVTRDLGTLRAHVPNGGLILFHDFNDPGNPGNAAASIGVVEAVEDSWVPKDCAFGGVFGACGLYVRRHGGPSGPRPGVIDLVRYDSPRLVYRQRVRWPLGRVTRRLLSRR